MRSRAVRVAEEDTKEAVVFHGVLLDIYTYNIFLWPAIYIYIYLYLYIYIS